MDTLETLLEKEAQARAALTEAENKYKEDSLAVRVELGKLLSKERSRADLSVLHMAAMLGTNRMKVFSCENPEKVPNPFSAQAIAEMIQAARKVADFCEMTQFKPIKRGRPPKHKKLPN